MRSLSFKLIIAFLAVSLIGVLLASVLARWITTQEFNRLVMQQAQSNFMAEVTDYYQSRGSWVGVTDFFRQKAESPDPPPRPVNPPGPSAVPPREPGARPASIVPIILIDQNGFVMHPVPPYRAGDIVPPAELAQGIPVMFGGKAIGTILAIGSAPPLSQAEQQYLDRTDQALFASALGSVIIALVLSVVLASTLSKPVRELTGAIRSMARGKLGIAVPVRSRDEIGQLTAAFNQMSSDLARSNKLREQMTADIAHDLRTPLTVIGGYIEALRDGVLDATPERYEVMHQEVQHLQRLVEDLRTLSLADAGNLKLNRQPIAPRSLLEQIAVAFRHQADQKKVALQVLAGPELPAIRVDEIRMSQVLGNLMNNALRCTPEGGHIVLTAEHRAQETRLAVSDDGVGIAPESLPHLFERFYRADTSRHSDVESGLGLAIAKSIVQAHGGDITVTSDGMGKGSRFAIRLPE
jgi:signal transduction histidine kinase